MDTRTLDTYASAYGVDAVVVAFNGNLGAFARDAGNGADVDEAVVDFGNFEFEESAEELLVGTRNGDFGVVVLIVDVCDYGTYGLAFAEEVAGDSLALGEEELVLVVVEEEGFTRPYLVNFAGRLRAL